MHNKVVLILISKFSVFCILKSVTIHGQHGQDDEISTSEIRLQPGPGKAQIDALDSDDDLNLTPPPFSRPTTPTNVEENAETPPTPTSLSTSTLTKSKLKPKKKKVTQQVVLEMQLDVLEMQKEMLQLKNEKLRMQVELLKQQASSCSLMRSIENL